MRGGGGGPWGPRAPPPGLSTRDTTQLPKLTLPPSLASLSPSAGGVMPPRLFPRTLSSAGKGVLGGGPPQFLRGGAATLVGSGGPRFPPRAAGLNLLGPRGARG